MALFSDSFVYMYAYLSDHEQFEQTSKIIFEQFNNELSMFLFMKYLIVSHSVVHFNLI